MGTNYYTVDNHCTCCNRYDEVLHIGKSSGGWAFSFKGYRHLDLTSWSAWKDYLVHQHIKDEYGETVTYKDFVENIEGIKAPGFVGTNGRKNLTHNEEGKKKGYYNSMYDWDDESGYSFTSRDFS